MRKLLLVLLILATPAYSQSNSVTLGLPSVGGSYESDRFRAGDLECQNAIGSATRLEFGVTGLLTGQPDDIFSFMDADRSVGVYSRIVIPLGRRVRERINCNELYELELRARRLEVMRLEAEIARLRELQFED